MFYWYVVYLFEKDGVNGTGTCALQTNGDTFYMGDVSTRIKTADDLDKVFIFSWSRIRQDQFEEYQTYLSSVSPN